jgi:hypothetical protein
MNKVSPEKSPFLWLDPLFLFNFGWKKPVPMSEIVKKLAKNDAKWRK